MSISNPYTPPAAEVLDLAPPASPPLIPPKILSQIKRAWIAGTYSSVVTLIATLISVSGRPVLGMGAEAFIDVLLIAGLTWGIYRKSRACAIGMVIYFLISKALLLSEGHLKGAGLLFSLVFLYLYVQGVLGTFAYHRLTQQGAQANTAS